MKKIQLMFSMISILLLVCNVFICVDSHGHVEFSFMHEDVHEIDCSASEGDLCYDEHAPCHMPLTDTEAKVSTSRLLELSDLKVSTPTFRIPRIGHDRYTFNHHDPPQCAFILEMLSTVRLIT